MRAATDGRAWDTAANGFSADWLADDLLAFADALGLDTFHLLGFSLGAMTALRVAVRAPQRLRTWSSSGSPRNGSRAPASRGG